MWSEAWPSRELSNAKRALDSTRTLVEQPTGEQPDEVTRALSRYLTVRACGYLETVVDQCCGALLSSKSAPRAAAFGQSWLGTGRNPSPGKLCDLVGRFDRSWADDLRRLLEENDERLRRELSFMVDRRNKIAHGASEGLTSRRALNLVDCANEVASWFIATFDPR